MLAIPRPLQQTALSYWQSDIFQAGSPQAGSSQPSPEDSTLSQAESALSQAGIPQASLADSTLFMAESGISQASHASQEDNTLSPTESELSQASSPSSLEEGTLQVESSSPPHAVRCLARLWARQAGTFPREVSEISQGDSTVPQRVLPQDNASQEARSSPCRHSTPQGSPPQRT